MTALRVALTGGLAAGKSTVAGWLREAGLTVLDADRVVAELYAPDGAGAAAVRALFGAGFLDPEGAVDHRRLAARVFGDPAARRRLEAAVHPLVRARLDELAFDRDGPVVVEVPLLVEAGMTGDFDYVVTVEANPEVRVRRAVARGLDTAEARRRLDAQAPEAERVAAADHVLRNDGSLDELRRQFEELLAELRRRSVDAG